MLLSEQQRGNYGSPCTPKKHGGGPVIPLCGYNPSPFYFTSRKEKNKMAIYHCSIKIISRGKGQSAVAAAAYRAGEKMISDYDGITHDYTRKGGVVHTEILLPAHAPAEYTNRTVLWNAVEEVEKAKNSQLAREIELALPAELTLEQNIFLVREYVTKCFVSVGMGADVCVHDKNNGNLHAHVMLTTRPFEPGGSWGGKQKKEYILDKRGEKIYDPQKKQWYRPADDLADRAHHRLQQAEGGRLDHPCLHRCLDLSDEGHP